METNDVIVLGGNHHNALGIIRSLGEEGWKVNYISTDKNKSFVSRSRYIKDYWQAVDEKEILNILYSEFKNKSNRTSIIPSDDHAMGIIDNNVNKLADNFLIPNINGQDREVLRKMDKIHMNSLAKKNGFLVPESYNINLLSRDKIYSTIENLDISYPCIIKPLKSVDGTKSDIVICKSGSDLLTNLRQLSSEYEEVIVQEYINKEGELGIQGFMSVKNGQVIIPGVIEKIRDSTIAPGSTTYAKITKSNTYVDIEKVKSLIRDINYYGIFDLELLYSKGRTYFIELNFRNGAYGYAYTKAGVNLPKLWCLDALGIDISEESLVIDKELTLMNEFADIRNVFAGRLSLNQWIKDFIGTNVYMILNKEDFMPSIYKILYK